MGTGTKALAVLRASVVAAVVLAGAGCASGFDGQVYRGDGTSFRVGAVPEHWTCIDVSDAKVAFRDDVMRATVAVNARCGSDAEDTPLLALTRHLFLYFTDRQVHDQRLVQLDGREALRTVLTAKLDGVERAFVVYVLKKNECVYDFMYISPPATFEKGAPSFDRFVMGFRTIDQP